MTKLILYIFGKSKSIPKCNVIKNSSKVIKVSSSSKPNGSDTVGFFSKNGFQIKKYALSPFSKLEAIL